MSDPTVEALARQILRIEQTVAGIARARQIERSTVGGAPVRDILDDAIETSDAVSEHDVTLGDMDAESGVDLDNWLEEQEEIHDADDAAHDGHYAGVEALEFVSQLEDDLVTVRENTAAALEAAANAQNTADGKNARRRGQNEPDPPEGGWTQGDEWVVENPAGVPVSVQVWNGTEFVHAEYLADSVLIPGENGAIRLGDSIVSAPNMATDALDAMTVRSLQIYGGYIEAPTIASSAKLGSGTNRLNDPQFAGPVNGAWTRSGYAGDAAASQTDNLSWDQSWTWRYNNGVSVISYRNWGGMSARLDLTPATRLTGSMVMANYSWLTLTTRTITDPFTFRNLTGTTIGDQLGGQFDSTWKAAANDIPAFRTPTARTTYLTNTASSAVRVGETWNVRLESARLTATTAAFVTATVELINAANSAVVWSRQLTNEELIAGTLNVMWKSTFNGNLRYRVKAVYTAGGGTLARTVQSSNGANQNRNGSPNERFSLSGMQSAPYRTYPREQAGPVYVEGNPRGPELAARARFQWNLKYALFAKVEAGKGWRLTEDDGLELFNSIGGRSAQFDGENNYFSGRMASAESGPRWEIIGDAMTLYDGSNTGVASLSRQGSRLMLLGDIGYQGDTEWANIPTPGGTGTCRWRRLAGRIYLEFDIQYSSTVSSGTAISPAFTLPGVARPAIDTPILTQGHGTFDANGYVVAYDSPSVAGVCAIRNTHSGGVSRFKGSGDWFAI